MATYNPYEPDYGYDFGYDPYAYDWSNVDLSGLDLAGYGAPQSYGNETVTTMPDYGYVPTSEIPYTERETAPTYYDPGVPQFSSYVPTSEIPYTERETAPTYYDPGVPQFSSYVPTSEIPKFEGASPVTTATTAAPSSTSSGDFDWRSVLEAAAGYTPDQRAWMQQLRDYSSAHPELTLQNAYQPILQTGGVESGAWFPTYNNLSPDAVQKLMESTPDIGTAFGTSYKAYNTAPDYATPSFSVAPNQGVRIIDSTSGNVLYSGTGAEGAAKASELTSSLPQKGWEVQTYDPSRDVWNRETSQAIPDTTYEKLFKAGVMAALTAAGAGAGSALAAPTGALSGLSTGVGAGLGAGTMNTLGNLAGGKSLGEALTSGAISGLTAGVLSGTPIGDFVNKTVSDIPIVGDAMNALGKTFTPAASGTGLGAGGELIVSGLADKVALPGIIGSLLPSALTNPLANPITSSTSSPTLDRLDDAAKSASENTGDGLNVVTGRLSPSTVTNSTLTGLGGGLSGSDYAPPGASDEIVVTGQPKPPSVVNNILPGATSTLTGLGGGLSGSDYAPPGASDEIVVTGQPKSPSVVDNILSGATSTLTGLDGGLSGSDYTPPGASDEIIVTGRSKLPSLVDNILSGATSTLTDYSTTTGPDGELVVTGKPKPVDTSSVYGSVASELLPNGPSTTPATTDTTTTTDTTQQKSTLDKVIDYLKLGALGSTLLGSAFGKSSSGGSGAAYLGSGTKNPTFSATLPTNVSLPGGVSSIQARAMPEQDWTKYGMHPEQSFFNYTTPGYTPEPGKTPGMSHGGTFAVRGPGSGRSDSIPAQLSDGEYVMDAETVALLGDGSSKAGAQKLDQFRVNLRKQKGRKLARGEFSVKAKSPEAYLAGGRT